MARPRSTEAAALLRLEIRRLPPEEQTELQRLRMTALELALPEDAFWMFLPESVGGMISRRRQAVRLWPCTAARLRKRSRRTRVASQAALAYVIPPQAF
jgi:hypothetical protein